MSKINFWMEMDAIGEVELEVTYSYHAGRPAVMYLKNGDPGYPAEPAELEVTEVIVKETGEKLTKLLADHLPDFDPFWQEVEMKESEPYFEEYNREEEFA